MAILFVDYLRLCYRVFQFDFCFTFFIDRKREYECMNMGVHVSQLVYGGQGTTWESEFFPFSLCGIAEPSCQPPLCYMCLCD